MNEQEFDEIGKRLYELEADPPEEGWKHIGAALRPTPFALTLGWLKRYWWKSMVIAIPVLIYFGYDRRERIQLASGRNDIAGVVEKSLSKAGENRTDRSIPTNPNIDVETGRSLSQQLQSRSEKSLVSSASEGKTATNDFTTAPTLTSREHITQAKRKAETRNDHHKSGLSRHSKVSGSAGISSRNEELAGSRADSEIQRVDQSNVATVQQDREINIAVTNKAGDSNNNRDGDHSGLKNTGKSDTLNVVDDLIISGTQLDSISQRSTADESETDRSVPTWRLTAFFMPQFLAEPASPIASDDVLVTNMKNSNTLKRTGSEVGLGLSRSIGQNWQLNAHISYSKLQQAVSYTYSDGKVDTLLTEAQADESVRVIPIYHTQGREISSTYHYAGVSLGSTFYFWSTAKTRFNFSFSAGAHYLMGSTTRERIGNEWIELSDGSVNKLNYSITVGAGYNIKLYPGVELMIAPTLKYYARDMRSANLPYKLNERCAGVNFMLSKTIGH